ncbi:MAG TPA: SpoIIE family protein phosphatase [Acidothermaceae bacterium]
MQSVIDLLGDAVLLVDSAGLVRAVNPSAAQLLGAAGADDLVGRPMVELVAEGAVSAYKSAWDNAWEGGPASPTPIAILRADGRTTPVELTLARFDEQLHFGEFAVAVVLRAGSTMARDALLGQLATAQRAQRFLLDAATVIMDASGFRETLRALAAVAVPSLGDICLIDVVTERRELVRMAAAHNDPVHADLIDELRRGYPPDPTGSHPSVRAMTGRHAVWGRDVTDDDWRRFTRDERHLEIIRTLGVSGFMCVPLITRDEVLGCLTVVTGPSGRRISPDDVALAEQLARQVAQVIAKERRYDEVRATSHTLQTSLLPTEAPRIDGLDIAVRYVPGTRDAEVGGDFWDVVEISAREVALTIGDVAGHDAVAAATMAQLRSVCRALRPSTHSPADLVDALQRTWDQLGLDRVATATFARLDRGSGQLRIASAGHPAPLLVVGGSAVVVDVDPSPPLGAAATPASDWVGELPVGGTLVFFTDGLVEDRYRDVDDGLRRLIRTAMSAPVTSSSELASRLLSCIPDDDRSDDVALLVVRRTS